MSLFLDWILLLIRKLPGYFSLMFTGIAEFSLTGIPLSQVVGFTCWRIWSGRPGVVPASKIHFGLRRNLRIAPSFVNKPIPSKGRTLPSKGQLETNG